MDVGQPGQPAELLAGQAPGPEHEPDVRQRRRELPELAGVEAGGRHPLRPPASRTGSADPARTGSAQPGTRGVLARVGPGPWGGPPNPLSPRRHGAGRADGPTPMWTTSAPACPHRVRARRSQGSARARRPAGRRRSHRVIPRRSNRRTRGVIPRAPGCPPAGSSSPLSTNRPGIHPAISACHSSGLKPEHEQVAEHHRLQHRVVDAGVEHVAAQAVLGDAFRPRAAAPPAPSSSRWRCSRSVA